MRLERVLTNDPGHRRRAARGRGLRRRDRDRGARGIAFRCVNRDAEASDRMRTSRVRRSPLTLTCHALLPLQALARPALPREVRLAHGATRSRCSCTSRSRCAATRAAASATTGRRRPTRRSTSSTSFADAARFFNPMLVTLHRRRAAAAARPRGRSSPRCDDAVRLKYITLITHGGMLTPERAQSLWDAGHQPVQHLARLPRRAARRGARHSRASRRRSSRTCQRDARRAASTHPLQHGDQETTTSTRSCRSCDAPRSWAAA